jgi:hypothetical protein
LVLEIDSSPTVPFGANGPSRRGRPGRLSVVSRLLEMGVVIALAGAVLLAAEITTAPVAQQPDDPRLVAIDPAGGKALSPPAVVTQRLATAGEQITVLVVGAVLGASHDGMCGQVELRFDGGPVHHLVSQVRYDRVEPYVTSTAVVTVPADAAAGDHQIGLYGPFAGVLSGPICPEAPRHQASIAAISIIVQTGAQISPNPRGKRVRKVAMH